MADEKALLSVLRRQARSVPPLWLLRQAGRYLPEYRDVRATTKSFLDFCYSPQKAADVTLQPIRRFHFDAAILFSDILVVPDAMGQRVSFESGAGPRLEPIETPEQAQRLGEFKLEHLSPVFETIDLVKTALPSDVAFIGFCGAPFTVVSYMIAGQGTPDQAPARLFAYRNPDAFALLIDRVIEASIDYLARQIEAGVEVVQIFDSWAGVLPANEFQRWSAEPVRRIVEGVKARHPLTPVIAFIRGADSHLPKLTQMIGADAYGIDTALDPAWAVAQTASNVPLQGNLDPLVLVAGGEALDREVDSILAAFEGRPHIFNLGHGILQQTPIENVERLVARVRRGA
ncbi:MAG: uroporphyrinogen decarboxylase [Methylocystis sp.]|nr:uroporphyrinogen decarboxylase [Methylocystis sp.]